MPHLNKTIAITRPLEDAQKMAAQLTAQGFKTLCVPMLRIEPVQHTQPFPAKLQAICATSKHAVRALARQEVARDVALLAVGKATADEAKQAGFSIISVASDTVESLLTLALEQCRPQGGTIFYARGQHVTCDLAAQLRSHGFDVQEAILYNAVEVETLPLEFIAALRAEQLDEVLFFSARSAANYMRLVLAEDMAEAHRLIVAACISKTVADALQGLPWKERIPSMAHFDSQRPD